MKKLLLLLACILINNLDAQEVVKLDDFGRISLNSYISDKTKIPSEAKLNLETKLKQIASNYGMAESGINSRFIITANISVTTKDIIAGPPQQVSQNMDITLFIGDAIENKIFSNLVISTSGVGTNENKAFIDAVKQINTKNKKLEYFLEEGKNKIIQYYTTQCDFINQKAITLKEQEKYAEAIYILSQIPEVCKDCYFKTLNEMAILYELKIDTDGKSLLNNASSVWSANPDEQGGKNASNYIMKINPRAKCYPDALKLLKTINTKVIADEKERLRKQEEYQKRQQQIEEEKAKSNAEFGKTTDKCIQRGSFRIR